MSDEATVTVRENPGEHRFEALTEPGVVAGFAAYQRSGDRVVFTHTEVDDAFEGQGVGSTLVRGALDAVRGEGVRVEAQCPFVRSYIERHQEYADLLG
jgi:uncharacterized protein